MIKKVFLDKNINWKNYVQVSKSIINKNESNYFNGNIDLKKYLGKIPPINIFDIFKISKKHKK